MSAMAVTRRRFLGGAAATALVAGCGPQDNGAAAPKTASVAAEDPFVRLDATAQAALVRRGEVTPAELLDAAIARIEKLDPTLNAVITRFYDRARESLDTLPEGPFHGVPYLIKDLDDLTGTRRTSGSRFLAGYISDEDGAVVRNSVRAGFAMLGKTNTPEFGLLASTEPALFGPTANPWHTDYSPGGSSGGAAAAVAAGMVPAAHATDGGGSIRIPASCCGLFGLKPSRGRMPPGRAAMPGDIGVQHCVSRTVRDSAAILAATEWRSEDAPLPPVGVIQGPSSRRLRVAVSLNTYMGAPHPDVAAAITATADLCEELGHSVSAVASPVDSEEFTDHFLTIWASGPAALTAMARQRGLDPADVFEPWTLGLERYFAAKPDDAIEQAIAHFRAMEARLAEFFADYDVWLSPVLTSPPPRTGEQAPDVDFDTLMERTVRYAAYTPHHNAAGTPAMSVPLGWSADGLPIGSQFAAGHGREDVLLALAYELEDARPWADQWPDVSAVNL